ncbi:GTP-binding protein RAD [Lingula anatina]|uniref:GTP-binding protein RAD n=1 Tax=Lingula anatina TaxID=7574 RepID=A0A1S3HQV6_LINAN|nr:GTP-binding protein RAD [Lingula anatina]|eukprot:XP_013387921.1 GTP-binding protein RAD [Lingula anatina]
MADTETHLLEIPASLDEIRPRSASWSYCKGSRASSPCGLNRHGNHVTIQDKRVSVSSACRGRPRSDSIPATVYRSLPNSVTRLLQHGDTELIPVREFSTSPKGLLKKADTFRIISRSNQSMSSTGSAELGDYFTGDREGYRLRSNSVMSGGSSHYSEDACSDVGRIYRVMMLGHETVGKKALVQQFKTLDFVETFDTDELDNSQTSISVVLNGEEAELVFINPSKAENTDWPRDVHADAYVIVYAVSNEDSFKHAERLLEELKSGQTKDRSIILVGNKTDLARGRAVSTADGKALAMRFNSKFIETSALLKINADELLVGILTHIRLREFTTGGGTYKDRPRRKSKSPVDLAKDLYDRLTLSPCRNRRNSHQVCEDFNLM